MNFLPAAAFPWQMHADLYVQLVDQLLAEVMVTRDLDRRDSLLRQALEWHEKAQIAAEGNLVPPFDPDRPGRNGEGRPD